MYLKVRGGNGMKIFDMDGPIYRIGNEIADALILTLMWVVVSLPLITIGASTSSLFYIYGKKARGEDTYVWRDFWKSFRENFKQSIPITLILGVMWISVYAYRILLEGSQGGASTLLAGLALFFTLEVTVVTLYVLATLSRFHMKVANMFLTSFVLAHRHLGSTILIIGMVLALQYASLVMPLITFVMPVLTIAGSSYFIQKIFTKHIEATQAAAAEEQAAEALEENYDDDEDEEETETEDKDFLKYI